MDGIHVTIGWGMAIFPRHVVMGHLLRGYYFSWGPRKLDLMVILNGDFKW